MNLRMSATVADKTVEACLPGSTFFNSMHGFELNRGQFVPPPEGFPVTQENRLNPIFHHFSGSKSSIGLFTDSGAVCKWR